MNQPKPFSPIMPVPNEEPVVAKAARKAPSTPNKIVGAKVLLQYMGEDGKVYEATTTVDPTSNEVQSYSLNVESKYEKKRDPETKDLIGFEDTGERILSFKVRYHAR
jgi:hypothetical protein